MLKLVKIIKWLIEITKEPIKKLIYNEAFIILAAKLPIVPKWCIKAVLKWTLNKTINPLIDEAYSELGFKVEVFQNELKIKKIQSAQDVGSWGSAIDVLMQSGNGKKPTRNNLH